MNLLDRATRRHLLEILDGLPVLDTGAGRTLLLVDLPPGLAAQIARSDMKTVDLANIVNTCAGWATAEPGALHPLHLLVENALDLARETPARTDLEAVLAQLGANQGAALADAGAAPRSR